MHIRAWSAALVAALIAPGTNAAGLGTLNLDDASSIKNVAATVAFDTMSYYNENQTGQIPGKLPDTWWEGGFLFNMLIQYWFYTGDTSYNPTVTQGLLWQKGANNDYMPQNWTSYLGNDDQVFWGLAAMTAAEVNYPEESGQPSWLALAQGVFETQAARWDYGTCAGGLRWQLFPYQSGYTLKNSVSNGGFFQLAARLAYYTNNQTYADWAIKMWDWCASVPLLSENDWNVADSVTNKDNCTTQGNLQWTYNYGCFFTGAAYMYNHTNGDATWGKRVDGLLNKLYENFFPEKYGSNVLAEPACDEPFNCNRDQNCFKGLVASWLGLLTYLKPNTAATIMPKLRGSATAAAKACVGGSNGRQCGLRWWQPSWDGSYGIEQEASVLSLMSVQLIGKTGGPPLTATTGGKSKSDPNAGSSSKTTKAVSAINTSDRAGAGILTALVVSALVAGSVWLVWP